MERVSWVLGMGGARIFAVWGQRGAEPRAWGKGIRHCLINLFKQRDKVNRPHCLR